MYKWGFHGFVPRFDLLWQAPLSGNSLFFFKLRWYVVRWCSLPVHETSGIGNMHSGAPTWWVDGFGCQGYPESQYETWVLGETNDGQKSPKLKQDVFSGLFVYFWTCKSPDLTNPCWQKVPLISWINEFWDEHPPRRRSFLTFICKLFRLMGG